MYVYRLKVENPPLFIQWQTITIHEKIDLNHALQLIVHFYPYFSLAPNKKVSFSPNFYLLVTKQGRRTKTWPIHGKNAVNQTALITLPGATLSIRVCVVLYYQHIKNRGHKSKMAAGGAVGL